MGSSWGNLASGVWPARFQGLFRRSVWLAVCSGQGSAFKVICLDSLVPQATYICVYSSNARCRTFRSWQGREREGAGHVALRQYNRKAGGRGQEARGSGGRRQGAGGYDDYYDDDDDGRLR